jgi:hypothetical protein
MEYGHWFSRVDFNPDNWFGFIYRISEIDTGRQYIGKKQFTKTKRKIIKGRINRKKIISESDWKSYTGSSVSLNEMILLKGKSNYIFEIESLHKTRGSLHYAEVEFQIKEDVLRATLSDGITKKFYNKHINAIKFLPPIEHSEETKMKMRRRWQELTDEQKEERLNLYFRGDNCPTKRNKTSEQYQEWLDTHKRGQNNPMFGKTFEELYGKDKAEEIKNILRHIPRYTGVLHPLYGKPRPDFVKQKISAANKGTRTGIDNHMFGKPCFYKMTNDEVVAWKENISKSTKGKPKSEDTKNRMSAASKGKPKRKVICPHCQKIGGVGNMQRYHFDNCKLNLNKS